MQKYDNSIYRCAKCNGSGAVQCHIVPTSMRECNHCNGRGSYMSERRDTLMQLGIPVARERIDQ